MAKTTLQLRKGSQAENAVFTGALGEVVVDTTRKTLVVHDGSTVGGSALATLYSPAFTGTPLAPTAAPGTNTTQVATTGFVQAAIDGFSAGPSTSDEVTEGTTNLYFTKDRVYQSLTAGGSISITENPTTKQTTISYTQPTNVSTFSNDAGYLTSASILNSLSVVSSPSGALTYDNVSGTFTFTEAVHSVNGLTGTIVLTTDTVSEGLTNKYASQTTVRNYLSAGAGITYAAGAFSLTNTSITLNSKTISLTNGASQSINTDDITEGTTNKYASSTNVRAQISAGTGISIVAGQISVGQAVGTTSSVTFDTASLTNNLTVNTSLIKTDATNSRVGINKLAPAYTLDVVGDINFTGALRTSGSAGTSGYVLQSAGNGTAPSWVNIANSLPEIYELDRLTRLKDGATTKFNPTSNGVDVTVSYPIQLTIVKNGLQLTPWLNKSGSVWQPLTPFGDYTVDSIGDIVFSTPPQPRDDIFMVVNVGRSVNPVYKTYPFRAIDIMLGT